MVNNFDHIIGLESVHVFVLKGQVFFYIKIAKNYKTVLNTDGLFAMKLCYYYETMW